MAGGTFPGAAGIGWSYDEQGEYIDIRLDLFNDPNFDREAALAVMAEKRANYWAAES